MLVSISLEHAPDHVLDALRHVPPVCGRKVVVALLDLAKERRLGVRLECEEHTFQKLTFQSPKKKRKV